MHKLSASRPIAQTANAALCEQTTHISLFCHIWSHTLEKHAMFLHVFLQCGCIFHHFSDSFLIYPLLFCPLAIFKLCSTIHFEHLHFCHSNVPPSGHISKQAPPEIFKICQCQMSLGPNKATASRVEAHRHFIPGEVSLHLSFQNCLCRCSPGVLSLYQKRAVLYQNSLFISSLTLSSHFASCRLTV